MQHRIKNKTHKGDEKWPLFLNKQLFLWSAPITLDNNNAVLTDLLTFSTLNTLPHTSVGLTSCISIVFFSFWIFWFIWPLCCLLGHSAIGSSSYPRSERECDWVGMSASLLCEVVTCVPAVLSWGCESCSNMAPLFGGRGGGIPCRMSIQKKVKLRVSVVYSSQCPLLNLRNNQVQYECMCIMHFKHDLVIVTYIVSDMTQAIS